MAVGASAASASPAHPRAGGYRQVNLVSNLPNVAPLADPDLVNAWGLSASPGTDQAPGSPLWVSDNGADKTTLYAGAGANSVTKVGLVVNIPSGAPTGQVFNTDQGGFVIHDGSGHSGSAVFLFDTENGSIDAWNPGVGATGPGPSTVTEEPVTNFANAVYKASLSPRHPTATRTSTRPTSGPVGSRPTTVTSRQSSFLAACSWTGASRQATRRSTSRP